MGRPRKLQPEHQKLLGTVVDAEVAKLAGMAVSAIALRRKQLGIPAFRKHRDKSVLPPRQNVQRTVLRTWSAEEDEVLRCNSGRRASRILGLTFLVVSSRRRELGIASLGRSGPAPLRSNEQIQELYARLGTGKAVARELGVSKQRAQQLMRRAGIRMKKSKNQVVDTNP